MNSKSEFPLVTIGIPTYNRYDQLEKVLDSALNQTYGYIEILIGDNSDRSEIPSLLLRQFIENPKITYVKHKKNLGAEANHQFLFDNAKGDFFIFFHDDDEYPLDLIEKLFESFKLQQDICLVAPCGVRFLEGKHMYDYFLYTSLPITFYGRIRDSIRRTYKNIFYMSEHIFYGLYKKSYGRIVYTNIHKFENYLLFQYLSKGNVHTTKEVTLIKNTTEMEFIKYREGSGRRYVFGLSFLDNGNEMSVNRLFHVTFQYIFSLLKMTGLSFPQRFKLIGITLGLFFSQGLGSDLKRLSQRS